MALVPFGLFASMVSRFSQLVDAVQPFGAEFCKSQRLYDHCTWGLTNDGVEHLRVLLEGHVLVSAFLDGSTDEIVIIVTQREEKGEKPCIPAALFGIFGLKWRNGKVAARAGKDEGFDTGSVVSEGLPFLSVRHALVTLVCTEGAHEAHHKHLVQGAVEAGLTHESVREQYGNEVVVVFSGDYVVGKPVMGAGSYKCCRSGVSFQPVACDRAALLPTDQLSAHVAFFGLASDFVLELEHTIEDYGYTFGVTCDDRNLAQSGCDLGLVPILFSSRADATTCLLDALNGGRQLAHRAVPGCEIASSPVFSSTWSVRTVLDSDQLLLSPLFRVHQSFEKKCWVSKLPKRSVGGYLVTLDANLTPEFSSPKEYERLKGVVDALLGEPQLEERLSTTLRQIEARIEVWLGAGGEKKMSPIEETHIAYESVNFRLHLEVTNVRPEGVMLVSRFFRRLLAHFLLKRCGSVH